jgi:hypothetical protein
MVLVNNDRDVTPGPAAPCDVPVVVDKQYQPEFALAPLPTRGHLGGIQLAGAVSVAQELTTEKGEPDDDMSDGLMLCQKCNP